MSVLSPAFQLSEATQADVPQVRILVNAAYQELADRGLNYTATFQDEATTWERMQQGRTFILREGAEIVATILYFQKNHFTGKHSAYLGQLAIHPRLKKSGLGGFLMDHCENLAREEKYEAIQLDTAKPATHLVNWYLKRGYTIVGETHWEGKTYDSYIFEKTL